MTLAGGLRQGVSGQRGLARRVTGTRRSWFAPLRRPGWRVDGAWMARGSHWLGGGELGHSPQLGPLGIFLDFRNFFFLIPESRFLGVLR